MLVMLSVSRTDLAPFDSMITHAASLQSTPEVFELSERMRAWRFYDHFRTDRDAPARAPQLGTRTPPFFQPLVMLETGEIYGYEVLARMRQPDGSLVMPDQFIHIAEELGLIGELTTSILRRACTEARDWPGAPLLSVNVSPVQFRDAALPQRILKALTETGFAPSRLQVEITEGALVQDFSAARTILTSLRNQGVRIALDDFGTGYSSLRHLRELPFDNLKIDRSFVQNMAADKDTLTIVRTIVDMATNLGVTLTAEGIETLANADVLLALGCKTGQGFWFGMPVEAEAVRAQLEDAALTARPETNASAHYSQKGAA